MKKELATHFSFFIAFFLFITLSRGWFEVMYIPFWFGGIIGTLLPDVDHLIYVYFLRPQEEVSQKTVGMMGARNINGALELLSNTRASRVKLIFHTFYFQLLFFAFTFFIITSSGSPIGRGLVLAFSLHLLIDQIVDFLETGNIDNWFREVNFKLDKRQALWYLVINIVILLVFGFLL